MHEGAFWFWEGINAARRPVLAGGYPDMNSRSWNLVDAHCHLGWFSAPADVARAAAEAGLALLAVTVTPTEFRALQGVLADEKNVRLAAGLHPWWVRSSDDVDALLDVLPETRFVGEVGLDASPRHAGTWDEQVAAFERICAACAEASGPETPKVLSVHAVRAADAVLDVLERTGAAERCRCVLHWFSGSSDELWRAARLGCWFSLGERSFATRRGREYARILPLDRLLLETDLPEAEHARADVPALAGSLGRAVDAVAAARGVEAEEVRRVSVDNATALLDV